jgi:pimeloyl-ACP methyl ester carboxylesterase
MGSPLGSFLCPPGYAGPAGLRAIAREASAVSEAARFARRHAAARRSRRETPYALRSPEPGAQPVVLVPGFMAGDGSLSLMARHLRQLGHRTYRSTMHANVGCTQKARDTLEERIETIATKRGRKVTVVGHSLGGLLARGIAARRPDLVEGIVTLGSPLLAPGAAHSLLLFDLGLIVRLQQAGLGKVMGGDCTSGDCARTSWEQGRAPLHRETAFTSVFSRRDGIIDWRACLDPLAKTVEVRTSHLGMAFDPVVLEIVGSTLAANRARRARTAPARLTARASLAAVPDASVG